MSVPIFTWFLKETSQDAEQRKAVSLSKSKSMEKPKSLSPLPSQALINHSPNGFKTGATVASGPTQLALALLFKVTGDKTVCTPTLSRFQMGRCRKVHR